MRITNAISILSIVSNTKEAIRTYGLLKAQTHKLKQIILILTAPDFFSMSKFKSETQHLTDYETTIIETYPGMPRGASYNLGLQQVRGDVIALANPEDWTDSQRLEKQFKSLLITQSHLSIIPKFLTYSYISGYGGYWTNQSNLNYETMLFLLVEGLQFVETNGPVEILLLDQLIRTNFKVDRYEAPHLYCKCYDDGIEREIKPTYHKELTTTEKAILRKISKFNR